MNRQRRLKSVKTRKTQTSKPVHTIKPTLTSLRTITYKSIPQKTSSITTNYTRKLRDDTNRSERHNEALTRKRFSASISYASPALHKMEHFITGMSYFLLCHLFNSPGVVHSHISYDYFYYSI